MRSRFRFRPAAVEGQCGVARRFVFLVPFILITACTMHSTTFDSALWKSQRGVQGTDNRRGGMVDDVEHALRVGMTRDEVHALLGAPDSGEENGSIDVYALGRSPYGIDETYYEVQYRDGRVHAHRFGQY